MSNDQIVRPRAGLEGVVFGETSISRSIPEQRKLIYRGYPVHMLATKCCFEETAFLLWHGSLPEQHELSAFMRRERSQREVSAELTDALRVFPMSAHPMDILRTGVSYLAMEDPYASLNSREENERKAFLLLAKVPTLVAYSYRMRKGMPLIAPDRTLGFAANFFYMCFGKVPDDLVVRVLDASFTLYAEHGFNASTFTSRVVVSSLADMYAGVVAAIGSLKGPLHGGANEQVMLMLQEIGSSARVRAWVSDALHSKRKIMGFGHRLYRNGDSRVPTMTQLRDELALARGGERWTQLASALETEMLERKGLHPNLDFPASPAYHMMGFDISMFTQLFVMARLVGWTAHITEQLADNRLVRPLSEYVGPLEREVRPIEQRHSRAPSLTVS
jgi:citrate synthase